MITEELLKNYNKALEQKYNAVCFDIDGTLTEENSTKIDSKVLPFLADILKKHIPIVFITGRGETGLNELFNDIIFVLQNKYNITNKQLLKMYAITNDGARLFMSDENSKNLFTIDKYISSEEDFIKLEQLNKRILSLLNSTLLEKYCKITYSKDSKTNLIINIRISVTTDDKIINENIEKMINTLIQEYENSNLNLTLGIHNGRQVFQIGTATKDIAIEVAERLIGIPQNSMLRIGDCGDKNGNDYSMLNCSQGFSVNKISGENDKCFPIIENGQIIKGVAGTLCLLKKIKLLPTICLEYATQYEYTKSYANIERKMCEGKNANILVFNQLIDKKFLTANGINSIFDESSGSVKIPMYEWISISNDNLLKQLWMENDSSSLNYALFDNENILLRGSKVYYYFLSQRFHDESTEEDITSKKMVDEWIKNNKIFFTKSLQAINAIDLNDIRNIKMILGIIDNIRNTLLILLNQQIIKNYENKNVIINLEKISNNTLITNIYKYLLSTEEFMMNLAFNNIPIEIEKIEELIKNIISILEKFALNFIEYPIKENYSKDFRAYREIDNFAENFITCKLTLQKNPDLINDGLCGICYGGLELPIIMKILDNRIRDVSILKFNQNVTGYTKKQSLELRFFDIFKTGGIELLNVDKEKKYVLMDDNLLTGKTMQLAITTLYDVGIDVEKVISVRYPGVNRISQMFMPNHGAIDYHYFFNFIEGLYFPSPYSWKDPNSPYLYEDSLGVFDLNRRKIEECLLKNGDYSKNSEIIYVKRK